MLDLYEFETAEVDVVPAGGDLSSDAAPTEETGATDEVDTTSSAATETAPAWDDPGFREAMRAEARQEAEALVRAQLAGLEQAVIGEPEPQSFNLDPFSETYAADLQAMIRAELSAIAGPLQARQEAETNAEGERRLQDMIADDITRNGDLSETGKAQIRGLLDVVFPEIAATYGSTARAAELAVQKATGIVRQIEADAEKRAVDRYKNELGTLSGAPSELGAGPTHGAVGATGLAPAQTIDEVNRRYAAILQGSRT